MRVLSYTRIHGFSCYIINHDENSGTSCLGRVSRFAELVSRQQNRRETIVYATNIEGKEGESCASRAESALMDDKD